MSLETFTASYIETALWAEHDECNGAELAPETQEAMEADCKAFYAAYSDTIQAATLRVGRSENDIAAGHDFWLTRNGHGAGFWDGDWSQPAQDILDNASKLAGQRSLYAGDDGLIYQMEG